MDVRRTLLHVGVLVGTPALSGALFGAPLMLDHGLRDHGLDLVFGGALIGAPAFSRTLVGDPTLLDDGPACGTLVTPFAHHGAMSYVQPVFN